MNTNGDPFSRIFLYENTFLIGAKFNKTAWKILKTNKNKQIIKAPKAKRKGKSENMLKK